MASFRKKSDEYWKKKLTKEQYEVLRNKDTETPFTGKFYKNFETGMYECAGCGQSLFSSSTKFDSDCGWPSFDRAIRKENVEFRKDKSFGMERTEVVCKNCQGHLGHVFDGLPDSASRWQAGGPKNLPDGRQATGKRFCINSIALNFRAKK